MAAEEGGPGVGKGHPKDKHVELIPREFLRAIAVWSLIPSYIVVGGLIGYLIDQALGWFPYITGVGLLVALVMAVRDMLRLRDEM